MDFTGMTPLEVRAWKCRWELGHVGSSWDQTICVECVTDLIAEEREACAQIAEGFQVPDGWPGPVHLSVKHECHWEECCADAWPPKIAAAIRARK